MPMTTVSYLVPSPKEKSELLSRAKEIGHSETEHSNPCLKETRISFVSIKQKASSSKVA